MPQPTGSHGVRQHRYEPPAAWGARELGVFTLDDLCDTVGYDLADARRQVAHLMVGGIVEDSGDEIDGARVFHYLLPPEDPLGRYRPRHRPPELVADGAYADAPERGRMVPGTGGSHSRSARKHAAQMRGKRPKMDARKVARERKHERQGR